jgi:hypothetical protein
MAGMVSHITAKRQEDLCGALNLCVLACGFAASESKRLIQLIDVFNLAGPVATKILNQEPTDNHYRVVARGGGIPRDVKIIDDRYSSVRIANVSRARE